MAQIVRIRGRVRQTGEPFEARTSLRIPGAVDWTLEESEVTEEIGFPLVGAPDPPNPTFLAEFVGLPSQIVESNSVQLDVDLFSFAFPGGPGQLVEDYDPTHWDKAISTNPGGATLTGVNGDQLTAGTTSGPLVVEFTYNVSGSPAEGTVATGTTEVVAVAVQNVLEIYNVPANVVEGQSYTLLSRELDGVTGEVIEDPATGVAWNVDSGPANITGGNTLNINASSAPNSVQVSASKTGVTGDSVALTVTAASAFPDNEPADLVELVNQDGSTKVWTGYIRDNEWNDDAIVSVVADGASKHGNVIEKRWTVGTPVGWRGITSRANMGGPGAGGYYTELFFRIVFKLSDNWDFGSAGGKFFYYRSIEGSHGDFILGWHGGYGVWWTPKGEGRHVPNLEPYRSSRLQTDVYHTIEIHHGASTAGANGFLRMWINGTFVPDYDEISGTEQTGVSLEDREWEVTQGHTDKRIGGQQAFLHYGGSGYTKNVNDFVRLSEMYISGKA